MLIKCPECGKEISDKASACIHCGYPISKQDDTTAQKSQLDIAPIIAMYKSGNKLQAVKDLTEQTGMSLKEAKDYLDNACREHYTTQTSPRSTAPHKSTPTKRCSKCGAVYPASDEVCPSCGNNGHTMMSDNSAHHNEYTVKCPTCGSTDVERITATAKVTNIALFGLFGNKRKMQFKCKSCKYMW